jgi:hypothetical protein
MIRNMRRRKKKSVDNIIFKKYKCQSSYSLHLHRTLSTATG